MTTTVKSITIGKYYISIEQEKYSSGYAVRVYNTSDDMCGYPLKENYYGSYEKANRRFSDIKREITKVEKI